MVVAMAVIGAVTRLTESGLSMVEWRPVTGWLPPLSETEWQHQYDLYKQSPEFQHKHHWMAVDDFKRIFFWEWLHRLWGRSIGIIFALPLLWFWIRKKLPAGMGPRFALLLVLGGLQGVIGWWMVKSGLVDNPFVSPYRLAVHLGMALLIFAVLWWTVLDLIRKTTSAVPNLSHLQTSLLPHAATALALLCVTIVWGAFVAGLDAGMIYNSFPLMDGRIFPAEPFEALSLVAEHGWVQFAHRWLGIVTGTVIFILGWRVRDVFLMAAVVLQVGLGIATILTQVWIPAAALHQFGAIILLAALLRALHFLRACRGFR